MNSVAALYFHDYHGLSLEVAGLLASLYGLMNLFARSAGGQISDWANRRFGMRGRIWACWIVQTIEGLFCMLMASVTLGMDAPFQREQVTAWTRLDVPEAYGDNGVQLGQRSGRVNGWVRVNGTTIMACGTENEAPPTWLQDVYGLDDSPVTLLEPPFERDFAAGRCIYNQTDTLSLAVFCMVMFSLCVQAAEGLHYGIVPYVSRPALGVVSGMVSAGGNLGAVILLSSFFEPGNIRLDEGFLRLGMVVCGLTSLLFLVYFPEHGSMLLRSRALGARYDPQLIKPPSDYRGADSVRMFVLGQVLVIGR